MRKKRMKNNLTKRFVNKELHRSDFLITIEEYVGAKGKHPCRPQKDKK